ncbi:hypothetical protein NDA13_002250 [Ustilago tritici]|nr:hypothetical protein NDA13_002250 [Ustilago tritici]
MKLEHTCFGALREKSRWLGRKSDRTRIQASSAVTCDGNFVSPKVAHLQLSHEELDTHRHGGPSRTSSVDSFGLDHQQPEYSSNSPVLFGDDKELHDPNFVRHNWEMMSGEATLADSQLHIGCVASPRLTSRRSTLSSRMSSRSCSRSGSEAGGHQTPTFGFGVKALSGLSSYAQAGSRRQGSRTSRTKGLQIEGSILRDEEAILYSDYDSSDEDEVEDDEYRHDLYPSRRLALSGRTSAFSHNAPPSPRAFLHPTWATSRPPSPVLPHAEMNAYHCRRHWTVAEGSRACNGAKLDAMPGQLGGHPGALKERSYSQSA